MRVIALFLLLLGAPLARAAPTIYYLHGKFIEEHGTEAEHPAHGRYYYHDILQVLGREGAEVVSGIRPRDTDVSAYADKIVADIRARLEGGQSPRDIAVVGASKGGVIAALVSARLRNDEATFVLMGACNDWLERTHRPRLHGRVLSVFDASDDIAGSCTAIAGQSCLAEFREIRLDTGRGHGFLYIPDPAWTWPVLDWISRRPPPPAARS